MSTVSPVEPRAETVPPIVSSTTPPLEKLVNRLFAEVDAADGRVRSLRTEAAKLFVEQKQRLMRFVAVADRIHAVLLPRLEAFTNVDVFKDIKQSVSLELRGGEARAFHGRTTKLTVPFSDKRPAPMEFSFHVGHDGPIDNAVVDYRLQVLPVFLKFDNHDQFLTPIDQPNEEAVAAWIEDKLVEFTRIYFEVYFNDEYQKKSLAIDPVMNVRFPQAFAAGKKEYPKRTYHFYTDESLELFEKDPSAYVEDVNRH